MVLHGYSLDKYPYKVIDIVDTILTNLLSFTIKFRSEFLPFYTYYHFHKFYLMEITGILPPNF